MKKTIRILICLFLLTSYFYVKDIWEDKKALQENLIRLHVVANSDSAEDQAIKLQIKNAVVDYLQPLSDEISGKEQAMALLTDNLGTIQQIANDVLVELGEIPSAVVSIGREAFGKREYATFSLPAGIYDSLRIQIGEGCGKNWWCVIFPSLCTPATAEAFRDTAVSSGFSADLGSALSSGPNLRFFILDIFGRLEKLFY